MLWDGFTLNNVFFKKFLKLTRRQTLDPIRVLDQKLVFKTTKKCIPRIRQFKYAHLFLKRSEKLLVIFGCILIIAGTAQVGVRFVRAHQVEIPTQGGTYREGIIGSVQHINPLFASLSSIDQDLTKLIFSSLTSYDIQGNLQYDIAENITKSDDETEYTIAIKKNVQFHDGSKLTVNDVAFTIELIQDEDVKSPLKGQFFNITTHIIDENTIKLSLKKPFQQFEHLLSFGVLEKKIWENVPKDRISKSTLNLTPIGSGPFKFDKIVNEHNKGLTIVKLQRNEFYYGKKPFIDTIEIKAVETQDAALDLFLKQEIDALGALVNADIERLGTQRATQYVFSVPEYTGIFFNQLQNATLKRQVVRDALSLALNKQQIIDDALKGRVTSAHSPFIEGMPGFIAGDHLYDAQKAVDILDEDKWERIPREQFLTEKIDSAIKQWTIDFQSTHEKKLPDQSAIEQARIEFEQNISRELDPLQPFFRKRNNAYLEINLAIVDNKDSIAIAEIIKASWRSIGVHCIVTPYTSPELQGNVLTHHTYDALLIGVVLGTSYDPYSLWYDAGNDERATLARFTDRTLDDILEASRNTTDIDKRNELYTKFQTYILEKKPAIVLYNPRYYYAVHPRVKGITQENIIKPSDRFAYIVNWYIKTTTKWQW